MIIVGQGSVLGAGFFAGAIVFKRIMVAYDGSSVSDKAFERSLRLYNGTSCDLAVVAAVGARNYALDYAVQSAFDSAYQALNAQVEHLERRARFAGLQATAIIGRGRLAREVVRAADDWHADLIIIGESARDIFAPWHGPSTAAYLVTHAHCAVLVVR